MAEEIKLTEDGGLSKRVLVAPPEGALGPQQGDKVFVHYVGTLADGSVFDSSRDRGTPFDFELGAGRVIKGWDVGVATMRIGEKSILTCRHDYAYGESGSPPKIPARATLFFEVELLRFRSAADIVGDGGVIKKVIKTGSGYRTPQKGSEAVVRHSVRLQGSDTPLATIDEYTILVGQTPVPRAWGLVVNLLKPGQELELTTRADYATGGAPELGIPEGKDVVLTIELLRIIERRELITETPGAAVMRVLDEGEGYDRAKEGALCEVTYSIINTSSGAVVTPETTSNIVLGAPNNAEALDLALASLVKNQSGQVLTTSDYLFSAEENTRLGLTAGTPVIIHVTLRSFGTVKSRYEMSIEEKVAEGTHLKDDGNTLFKAGLTRRAIRKYQGVLECFSSTAGLSEADKTAANALTVPSHLNLAQCFIKLSEHRKAVEQCDKALAIDPKNSKGLYRKAHALAAIQELDRAKAILTAYLETDPNAADFKALLASVNKSIKAQNDKDAATFKRMFA